MTKSKGIRKRRVRSREKLRDILIDPQTSEDVAFADEHIATEAKLIKANIIRSMKSEKRKKR